MKKLLLLCLGIVAFATAATAQSTATLDFQNCWGSTAWTNSYTAHTVDFTEATVDFSKASKQSSTISEYPVMKGGDVTVTMKTGYTPITKITLQFKQWNTKLQTVKVAAYSTDGTTFTDLTDGPSASVTDGELVYDNVPDGTVAVKFTSTNTSNQIGFTGAVVEYGTLAPGEVAKPKASVESGTFHMAFDLELTCATEDAQIFYSMVRKAPSAGDTAEPHLYTTDIRINEPCYIEAYAEKDGNKSETLELNYDFKAATPYFSPESGIFEAMPEVTLRSATINAIIRYTTDGTEPTASSTAYTAPFTPEGENVTIKAQAYVDDWTPSDVVTATYEVGEKKGTLDNPLTASEAAELALGGSTAEVYVKGIVSSIISTDATITSYKNLDYNISDDGTTTATQFEVFRGKYFEGADFTTDNKLKAGDEVVVLGALTTYNGTPELAAGSTLILLNGSDKPENPDPIDPDPVDPDDPQTTTVTFDFTANEYGMTVLSGSTSVYNPDPTTIELDDVTLTLEGNTRLWKASGGNELRFYKGSTMTFSVVEPNAIIKITLGQNGGSFGIPSEAASVSAQVAPVYDNGTWTGEAQSVTLGYTPTNGNKAVKTIEVTYKDLTGIEGIEAEQENVPAVFYNLQGVQVANPTSGIYVRVQGSKATKVLVK